MATKTITINGKFTNSLNRFTQIDFYRANPDSYDFSKTYNNDFKEIISDLKPDTTYFLDITGYTFGDFELNISGDFVKPTNPISEKFTKTDFKPGYTIQTTK